MSEDLGPEQRARVVELFERASELPEEERAAFVARECGADSALRRELQRALVGLATEGPLSNLEPNRHSRVGTRIGPYELLEKLGEGGMGEVYVAQQQRPVARRVALKIIKPGMESASVLARFEAERQALARMAHPNIAQVHDAGATESGSPYFVMELVAGEPITDYCDRERLTTRARIELFIDVCNGVQHAHQKGVIHRDLKPSNLLVTGQDGRALPKIIDFGVARATTGTQGSDPLQTMLGQIVGTLDYMSPEQADTESVDLDTRSDVYSLGVVLYQLLCGLLPFGRPADGAQSPLEVQRLRREVDPPTPSTRLRREQKTATALAPLRGTDERSLVRQLSGDLDWICMKALEKEPGRRYASAAALADDLRRHLAHEPVLAGRPGALYRARKFLRRNRGGVTVGALGVLAALAGTFGAFVSAANARVERAFAAVSDLQRLADLLQEADELWPPHPDRVPALEAWSRRAAELKLDPDGLERRRAQVATLRARSLPSTEGELQRDHFVAADDYWLYTWLTAFLSKAEAFRDADTGLLSEEGRSPERGWSVPKRIALAKQVGQESVLGPEAQTKWAEASASIRSSPIYDALELAPQMGLVPLGQDPQSGLWEFAHILSGEVPERRPDGTLEVTPETAIVLALIPAGSFVMGAQSADPSGPNYYELANERKEGPPVVERVAAFFLAKHELTQGQWTRCVGRHPGNRRPMSDVPVVMVSWRQCDRVATWLGLRLPHEREWEYAARAVRSPEEPHRPWSTGEDATSLMPFANLFDQSVSEANRKHFMGQGSPQPVEWDDGCAWATSVADPRFAPNAFGLHHMLGNVTEWCSNAPYAYGSSNVPYPDAPLHRSARGGSWLSGAESARPAFREFRNDPDFVFFALGVRLARDIDG